MLCQNYLIGLLDIKKKKKKSKLELNDDTPLFSKWEFLILGKWLWNIFFSKSY